MPEPTKSNAPQTLKGYVPEADFLRVKGSLEARLKASEGRNADLESRLNAFERERKDADFTSQLAGQDDTTKLHTVRQSIVAERSALEEERKKLQKDREEVATYRLTTAKAEYATKYGVDPTVLDSAKTPEEAELAALRAVAAGGKKNQEPGKPDVGGGGSPNGENLPPIRKLALGMQTSTAVTRK